MSVVQISVQDVSVQLGMQAALKGVNLQIKAGERVALVGSNGSGKSTLLRTLHALQLPTQGQVLQASGVRQAMLFQRPHLLRLSALNNVALGLWLDRARGLKWQQAQALARLALQRVGLDSVAMQGGRQLSGGQQQRLCIARAIATNPEVILMDEPCSALDPIASLKIEDLIYDLREQFTIIIVTHNMQQAARVSDITAFMLMNREKRYGELIETGPTDQLFTKPSDKRTEDYISGQFG